MKTALAKTMKERGITGVELSRFLSVGEADVSKWRRGVAYVPEKYREGLAELVGIPLEELLDERGIPRITTERASAA